MGVGAAAARRPVGRELGQRRPRRRPRPSAPGQQGQGGHRLLPAEPAPRPEPRRRGAAEPVLRLEPLLPEPAVPADRGRPGRRAAPTLADLDGAGRALNERPAHRPARRCGRSSATRSSASGRAAGGDQRRRRPADPVPRRLRHLHCRAGRGARRDLDGRGRRTCATPTGPAVGRLRGRATPTGSRSTPGCSGCVDGQLARGAQPTIPLVHDLAVGVDPDGCDAWLLAGPVRPRRHAGRRAARRVQHQRPGLGPPAVRPVAAPRRRLRAVRPTLRSGARPRPAACASTTSWGCSACSGSRRATRRRRRLRPLPGRRAARHRRPREPPAPAVRRRRGPRHGRGRRAGDAGRAPASSPTGCCGSSDAPAEHYPVRGAGRRHHPRPADARRRCGRARPGRPASARHGAERRGHPRGPGPLRVADRRRRRHPLDEVARRAHETLARAPSRIVVPSWRTRRAWRSGRTCRARPTAGPTGAWPSPSRSRPCWVAR